MTAPLTRDEEREVEQALPDLPYRLPPDFNAADWVDVHAAVARLAWMGLSREYAVHLAMLVAEAGRDLAIYEMIAATIETWGRAILETVRAHAKAQEGE